ncbi:MAG: geranylgeranylglyceryl/heptaprenylglyceryl phosphate synthase [Thaumarchaeota archaeon]|nr:geranylgeranylglyceryl/heptaprenylglyceryl phosphate synthase [Nitrososphaerota archaeon]
MRHLKIGKVEEYLLKKLESGEKIHLLLLDPEEISPERGAEVAGEAEAAGSDGIMVGGSTFFSQSDLDNFVKSLKSSISIPVIIFPNNITSITRYADAVWFMSMLNSVDHYFIIGAQSQGAVLIKQYGLEAIPMGYMVFGGDTAVAAMGRALPLPPSRGEVAACYALAAQYLGMRFVYLEAGSGAREPIPPETIRAVRRVLEIPLIVGGGIRSPEDARRVLEAGADIVVTGTIAEENLERCKEVIAAVKSFKKRRQLNP